MFKLNKLKQGKIKELIYLAKKEIDNSELSDDLYNQEIDDYELPDFLHSKKESVKKTLGIQGFPNANLKKDIAYKGIMKSVSAKQKTAFGMGHFLVIDFEIQGKRSLFINETIDMCLSKILMELKRKDVKDIPVIVQKQDLTNKEGINYESAVIYLDK